MKTVAAILIGFLLGGGLHAARLKDLVAIEGVRENQLMGYGIVGLAGTGDRQQTVFSNQSLTNILERWVFPFLQQRSALRTLLP